MCKNRAARRIGFRLRQKPIEARRLEQIASDLLVGVPRNPNIASFLFWRAARTIQTYERLLKEAGVPIPERTD